MIEHYLKCDSCGKKHPCFEKNSQGIHIPKKMRKGMIFLKDTTFATSNSNHIGYWTQRSFVNMFFCGHGCLRVFLRKELGE